MLRAPALTSINVLSPLGNMNLPLASVKWTPTPTQLRPVQIMSCDCEFSLKSLAVLPIVLVHTPKQLVLRYARVREGLILKGLKSPLVKISSDKDVGV